MDTERLFSLTRDLVAIDSVTGHEGPIVAFLEDHLRARGYDTRTDEAFEGRPNLLALRGGAAPRVLFNTHVDTVPPQYGPHEDDDKIYGRGACDTHGILAAMLEAIDQLHADGVEGVGLLAVVDEEGGEHRGTAHAGRQFPEPEILIVGEPTQNRLVTYQKGLLKADLVAGGVDGHSGYPECCDSAVQRLMRTLAALQAEPWLKQHSQEGTTLNVYIPEGGDAYNKVPGRARAGLYFRLTEPMAAIRARVEAVVGRLDDALLSLEWLGGNDPVTHLGSVTGFETTVAAYNTDVAHFGWSNARTFLIGPGSILNAHRDLVDGDWSRAEWVRKIDLVEGARLYVRLVKTLLGT